MWRFYMWKTTNYHNNHCQSNNPIIFENEKWYEIGFQNKFQDNFSHQGIMKFNNGFKEDGYHLKPFPTHARCINLSKPYTI